MKEEGSWGEFFPVSIAPFAYNESVAFRYFPLSQEEALKQKFYWREKDNTNYQPQTYSIPNTIKSIPDEICDEILACQETGKNYRVQSQELKFYRDYGFPIPLLHPDTRTQKRFALRNPRQLWERKCSVSGETLFTSYAPNRPEKIVSESAYREGVD